MARTSRTSKGGSMQLIQQYSSDDEEPNYLPTDVQERVCDIRQEMSSYVFPVREAFIGTQKAHCADGVTIDKDKMVFSCTTVANDTVKNVYSNDHPVKFQLSTHRVGTIEYCFTSQLTVLFIKVTTGEKDVSTEIRRNMDFDRVTFKQVQNSGNQVPWYHPGASDAIHRYITLVLDPHDASLQCEQFKRFLERVRDSHASTGKACMLISEMEFTKANSLLKRIRDAVPPLGMMKKTLKARSMTAVPPVVGTSGTLTPAKSTRVIPMRNINRTPLASASRTSAQPLEAHSAPVGVSPVKRMRDVTMTPATAVVRQQAIERRVTGANRVVVQPSSAPVTLLIDDDENPLDKSDTTAGEDHTSEWSAYEDEMKALDGYYVIVRGNKSGGENVRRPYMEALSPQTKLFTYNSHTLIARDLARFDYDQLLNDSNIAFYLDYIAADKCHSSLRDKVYIYDTFFASKLLMAEAMSPQRIQSPRQRSDPDMQLYLPVLDGLWTRYASGMINAYAKLKGRTRKVNIFEKDILVLPVHDEDEQHWYVAIVIRPRLQITPLAATAEARDKQVKSKNSVSSCIVIADSLGCSPNGETMCAYIRAYLAMEYARLNRGSVIKMSQWEDKLPQWIPNVLRQQQNDFDCGVLVLMYVEKLLSKELEELYDHTSLKNSLDPDEDENKTRMDLIDLCIRLAARPKEDGGSGYVICRDKNREPPEQHCIKREPDETSADNLASDCSDYNASMTNETMQSGSTTSNRPTRARIGYP